jgi:protein phosphatase
MAPVFRCAARSEVGLVRSENQDSGYAGARLVVVADGMGGHAAGDVASSATVSALAPLDTDPSWVDPLDALRARLDAANARLREIVTARPELEGMGTTVTALLRAGAQVALAHVGDSRCYLLRAGALTRLTRDDTFVQTLVDSGQITAEEAAHHPQRSVLTQALDGRNLVVPHLSVRPAQVGDRYLLCSDGLSAVVTDETIQATLAGAGEPAEAVDRLVDLALRAGGPDNITCLVADVVEPEVGGAGDTGAPLVVGAVASAETGAAGGAGAAAGGSTASTAHPREADTPALRAASLRRQAARPGATGAAVADDDSDGELDMTLIDDGAPVAPPVPRHRRARRLGVLVLTVAIIAGLSWWGWTWSQQQYYVGAASGKVAIYQGLPQSLGSVTLSSVHEVAEDVALADLPSFSRQRVQDAIVANDLADARRIVAELRAISAACRSRAGLPGCGGGP